MSATALARARDGDGRAFGELVDPYRLELYVHCYRLLGSVTDAEDAVQETLLAAWRGLAEFAERASVRTWLYRIATNQCLNSLRRSGRRGRPAPTPPFEPPARYDVPWLEPLDTAGWPDESVEARETSELAFIEALQRMPPRQAATLVLVDVLDFRLTEVAAMLDTTEAAVKGALARARAARPGPSRALRPGSPEERDVCRRFAEALASDDVDGVVALLTDAAWLGMPPAPHRYVEPPAVAAFLRASATWRAGRRYELTQVRRNAQPAFVSFLDGSPAGTFVLTLDRQRIAGITRFLP